ncbi:hypothetical protein F5Y09DRAFT_350858 [Xylaria sp. FL1042]|nr:hypothetical protein F5Y09DRAFT_350858 [Xylaria sp. FL1042]
MFTHNSIASSRDYSNSIEGGKVQAFSSLLRTDNADSCPRRPHDHAGEETCARSDATLVEALTIWRERAQKPPSTNKPRRLPSRDNEFIKSDGRASRLDRLDGQYTCPPSARRSFPSLSELFPHLPSSPRSSLGLRSIPGPASDGQVSSTVPESDMMEDETVQTAGALHSTSRAIREALLLEQSAVIQELVKQGKHLAALIHALRYSYDFTFEKKPSEVFSARIHIFNINKKNEVTGITMRFHKALNPSFKRFLARRLLNGVLIRYPKGSFPRTFWVAEGDETPVILQTYNAVEDVCHKFERCECCRDLT